jgi:hypothetical protein
MAAVPKRAHPENDEDDRSDKKDLRKHPHALRGRTLGDGRAEAEEALARHHDQQ